MFKSSRLAELAPGVFLPEYPHTIKPRQNLIPTLARLLASFKRQRFVNMDAAKWDRRSYEHSIEAEWYEEKLWTSMVSALRVPSRACPTQTAPAAAVGSGSGTYTMASDVREVCKNREESCSISTGNEPYPLESQNELDWLSRVRNQEISDDEMLTMSSVDYSDGDSCLLDTSESDEESFHTYFQKEAAEEFSRAHLVLLRPNQTGTIGGAFSDAELSDNDEYLGGALTHINQTGKSGMQVNQQRESQTIIGSGLLIHQADSTHLHNPHTDHEMKEVLISENFHNSVSWSRSSLAIRDPDNKSEEDPLIFDHQSDSSEDLKSQLATETTYQKTDMAPHPSSHSLSEVLGGDHLLWNIWKRRGSAAPPEAGDMLEMHTMFENDPDMRLLSSKREDRSSYDDSMMYGSFDFSRKTTQSSESSWAGSPSDELLEEPFEDDSKFYPQSSQSSTQSRTSLSTPNKTKRRPSVLQKLTRPPRMSEDDILFQQSSPTRQVDIKKRKTLLDYHRAQ